MWMSDSQVYYNYIQAKDKEDQLSILCQPNACTRKEILDAIARYKYSLNEKDQNYKVLSDEVVKPKKVTHHNTTDEVKERKRVMIKPTKPSSLGISTDKISVKGIKQREGSVVESGVKQIDDTSDGKKKSKRSKDIKLRWRKRTTIVNDYDVEWNSLIDSMRMYEAKAKECEKKLIQLEKTHGSKRRKENRIK